MSRLHFEISLQHELEVLDALIGTVLMCSSPSFPPPSTLHALRLGGCLQVVVYATSLRSFNAMN
jgi:hypothetical protein